VYARVRIEGRELSVDLSRPLDLALELNFAGAQPRHFGAPRASAREFTSPGSAFNGSVARGASCNCEVITLIPHCNGTHTECAGHLTRERLDAWRVAPTGLTPALLLSVVPEPAAGEGSEPAPQAADLLITRGSLERSWCNSAPFAPRALIIRTLPNSADKRVRDYTGETPPYLSREAAQLLVSRGILHLVVDVPSIDRAHDEGRLAAHHIFFGLPPTAVQLAAAARPDATITELAFVPDSALDGFCLLELQVPALSGDAVPSRPLLYPITDPDK
jgi:arylformamidase